jgi:adenylate cyclase
VQVSLLRRLLGSQVIATIPRRGYQFVASINDAVAQTPRPQSAAEPDVSLHQRSVIAVPELPDQPSIAVLPFVNMSTEPEQAFFSDGISEDIITELGRYKELFVIARSSSFAFKHTVIDSREVGRMLGVRYLLQGSVRKMGHRIRVTAQLVDTLSAIQDWADRYDRDMSDFFAIQDELARSIVSTVRGRVEATIVERVAHKPIGNLSAYECVVRGQALIHQYTRKSMAQARLILESAIALDPGMARAMGWLAYVDAYESLCFQLTASKLDRPTRLAEMGLALDPNDNRCHLALGIACLFRKAFEKARHHLAKAAELNPNDDLSMIEWARYLMYTHDATLGAEQVRRAMRQNPFHPNWYWNVLARCLHTAKQYQSAIEAWEQMDALHYWHHAYLAACNAELGRTDLAHRHAVRVMALKPDFSIAAFMLVHPYRDPRVWQDFFEGYRKAGLPE